MSIQKATIPYSVKQISKGKVKEKLNFSLSIQRNEVWDEDRKSLFIHSLIFGYPIPPIYCQDNGDDVLFVLDGKQRLTTIQRYSNDEFALSVNTPEVDGYEVAGLKYSELPEEIRDSFNEYCLTFYQLRGITENERDEIFLRLNNGISLTKFELTRAMAHGRIMDFVKELSNTEFFHNKTMITDGQRNKFTDQECVLQMFATITEKGIGFSGKEIQAYAKELKENGLSEDIKATITATCEYLNTVFPEKCKYIKKANIPVMFFVANIACIKGVDPVDFFDWINKFYTEMKAGSEYNSTCSAGSAKKDNIQKRLNILVTAFDKQFNELHKNESAKVFPLKQHNSNRNYSIDRFSEEDSMIEIPHNIRDCAEHTLI